MRDINAPMHLRMASWWIVETRLEKYYLSKLPTVSYMLVQYEHLASFPLNVIQEIYHFLGMSTVPEDLMRWLLDHTTKGDAEDRYGISRNSAEMVQVWKDRLSATQLKEIESLAKSDFEFFGYSRGA